MPFKREKKEWTVLTEIVSQSKNITVFRISTDPHLFRRRHDVKKHTINFEMKLDYIEMNDPWQKAAYERGEYDGKWHLMRLGSSMKLSGVWDNYLESTTMKTKSKRSKRTVVSDSV